MQTYRLKKDTEWDIMRYKKAIENHREIDAFLGIDPEYRIGHRDSYYQDITDTHILIEYSLYPWMKEHNIPVMAYCPMAQGASLKHELMTNKELIKIAEKYDLSIPELLLAFVLQKDNIIAIPRTSNPQHALRNAKVADVKIDEGDLEIMDREFPAPDRKVYLDIV